MSSYYSDDVYPWGIKAIQSDFIEAFSKGAQWLADHLCHLPLDKVLQELAEYINQREEETE